MSSSRERKHKSKKRDRSRSPRKHSKRRHSRSRSRDRKDRYERSDRYDRQDRYSRNDSQQDRFQQNNREQNKDQQQKEQQQPQQKKEFKPWEKTEEELQQIAELEKKYGPQNKKKEVKPVSYTGITTAAPTMIEIIVNDRLGKKERIKCRPDDKIGDIKKLIAAKTGTRPDKIRLQKWYNVYKDHITLEDYEIKDGMNLEMFYN